MIRRFVGWLATCRDAHTAALRREVRDLRRERSDLRRRLIDTRRQLGQERAARYAAEAEADRYWPDHAEAETRRDRDAILALLRAEAAEPGRGVS